MPETESLSRVVDTVVTKEGITNVTVGAVACGCLRSMMSAMLRGASPEHYAQYRAVKYPEGPGSDSMESRRTATRLLFDLSRDLLVPHYLPRSAVR